MDAASTRLRAPSRRRIRLTWDFTVPNRHGRLRYRIDKALRRFPWQ
jgi:hypothetical protein